MLHAPLQPTANPKLLSELPRFFGGVEGCLRELLQNALRAGARRVTFQIDEQTRRVTLSDDGPGLASPQVLLEAGRSGWGERVIDPAGIGLFSTLLPQFEAVTFASHDWLVVTDPSVLTSGRAVDVLPWNTPRGFAVDLTLKESDPELRAKLQRARGLLDLEVVLQRVALPKIEPLAGAIEVATPVGRLLLGRPTARDFCSSAVWEGQLLGLQLTALLPQLSTRLEDLEIVLLKRGSWLWWPDAQSGVYPQLPDRRSMIASEALLGALCSLAVSLTQQVRARWSKMKLGALERFTASSNGTGSFDLWQALGQVGLGSLDLEAIETLLRESGFENISVPALGYLYLINDGDGEWNEVEDVWWESRPLLTTNVAAAATVNQLRAAGEPLALHRSGGLELRVDNPSNGRSLRLNEAGQPEQIADPSVVLAQRIVLGHGTEFERELPFLIEPYKGLAPDTGPVVVLAGPLERAIGTLEAYRSVLGGAYLQPTFDWNTEHYDSWQGGGLDSEAGAQKLHACLMLNFASDAHRQHLDFQKGVGRVLGALRTLGTTRELPTPLLEQLEGLRPELERLNIEFKAWSLPRPSSGSVE